MKFRVPAKKKIRVPARVSEKFFEMKAAKIFSLGTIFSVGILLFSAFVGVPELFSASEKIPMKPFRIAAGAPKPFGAIPTEQQVQWQRLEFYGFVHFGLNTFTNREWGYGDEDPQIFFPKKFDAFEIAETAKNGGMAGIIYTAKHHDGFCMWPTKSTSHNISKTPWKNGKGDVVKEFSEACKRAGIKFGTYLSPWDRNHKDYGNAKYLAAYYKQIEELLTNYGPIFEIWFDGANGGDGFYGGARERRNIGDASGYYNFKKIVEKIRRLQPNCIVWGAGKFGDARWGGSEKGFVNYPHWATSDSKQSGTGGTGVRLGDKWLPAEADTTINSAGWFWHPNQDAKVKSPEKLLEIWFESVGRGANLILNIAPNRDGKLDPADVKALLAFKSLRERLYKTDFALNAKIFKASSTRNKNFEPRNLTDGNLDSFWAPSDSDKNPSVEIKLPKAAEFDVVRVREEIRLGQRVENWALDAFVDNAWQEVVAGTSIGNQALLKFPAGAVFSDRIRLRIKNSPAVPCLSEISLFKFPAGTPVRVNDKIEIFGLEKSRWKVVAGTDSAKNAIDGNGETFWESDKKLPQSFVVDMGKVVPVKAFSYLPRQDGNVDGMTTRYVFEVSLDGKTWRKVAVGEFGNLEANPIEQIVEFPPENARFFRFTGTAALGKDFATAAEISVFEE